MKSSLRQAVIGFLLVIAPKAFPIQGQSGHASQPAPARSNKCPATREDFMADFKNQLASLSSPENNSAVEAILQASKVCAKQLPISDRDSAFQCVEDLENLSKTFDPKGVGLGLSVNQNPPAKPLDLPDLFYNDKLYGAFTKGSQADIDAAMATVHQKFPDSKNMQFVGASGKDTFMFMIQMPHEILYIHVLGRPSDPAYRNNFHATPGGRRGVDIIRQNLDKVDDSSGRTVKLDPPTYDYFIADNLNKTASATHENCASCHRPATLPAIPFSGEVLSHTPGMSGPQVAAWFQDHRGKEGEAKNSNFAHLGPEIGPQKCNTRTDAFMKDCISRNKEIASPTVEQIRRIKSSMDCTGCHAQRDVMPSLQYPTHTRPYGFIIFDGELTSGEMPPHSSDPTNKHGFLEPAERRALATCLKAEYFGGFQDPRFSQGNSKPGILMNSLTTSCRTSRLDQFFGTKRYRSVRPVN